MVLNKYIDNAFTEKGFSSIKNFIKKMVFNKNFAFFILMFMVSMQSFVSNTYPFSYALMAVASLFNVPLLLVLISGILSFLVFNLPATIILKLIIFFVLFSFFTAAINIEGINKKYAVLIKLILSMILMELILLFFIPNIKITDSIVEILTCIAFYIIFVYGNYVMLNVNKGFIFSKEEIVAYIAMLSVAFGIFKNVNIMSLSILNILVVAMVLIFGLENGAFMGATSGLIVGLITSIITGNTNTVYILSLAFAGLMSGLLKKFGKYVVAIAFVLSELLINYWANGFSELAVRLSEMLIAVIPILFMPKKVEKNLDFVFNSDNLIKKPYEQVLDYGSDIKNRLNAVSDVFNDLSNITIPLTEEDGIETRAIIKNYILDFMDNNCIDCLKKGQCVNEENLDMQIDYIASKLENNEDIDTNMLNIKCDSADTIVNNVKEIYNSMKLMRIIKQNENENNLKLSKQYKEISNIIATVSKNIVNTPAIENDYQKKLRKELKLFGYQVYEDKYESDNSVIEYTFVTDILNDIEDQEKEIAKIVSNILEQTMSVKLILNSSKTEKSNIKLVSIPKYEVEVNIETLNKTGQDISGDSYLSMEMPDLKQINIISDGEGSGFEAQRSSKLLLTMLEKLLKGGFDKAKAIEIINSVLKLKSSDQNFATLDAFIFNLKTAQSEYIKIGAAPTYVIEDGKITVLSNCNIPVGILSETSYVPIVKNLKSGDIVIQFSDGAITSDMDINDNYLKKFILNMDLSQSSRIIAQNIMQTISNHYLNSIPDDVTVMVTKIDESRNRS